MEPLCCLFAFLFFCLSDCYLFSLPVVVSRVEIALGFVIVKCKRDEHVSNIFSFYQICSFKEITDGQFLMVKQKLVTRKSNHCVACLLFFSFLFVYIIT